MPPDSGDILPDDEGVPPWRPRGSDENPLDWLADWRSPANLMAGFMISVACLGAAFILLGTRPVSGDPPFLYRDEYLTVVTILCAVSMISAACFWGPAVTFKDAREMVIQNPLSRHNIPLTNIKGATTSGLWHPFLLLSDGSKIRVWALDLSYHERAEVEDGLEGFLRRLEDEKTVQNAPATDPAAVTAIRPPAPVLWIFAGWLLFGMVRFLPAWQVAVPTPLAQ